MARTKFLDKVTANKDQRECLLRLDKLLKMRAAKQHVKFVHCGRKIVFDNFYLVQEGGEWIWKGCRVFLDKTGTLTFDKNYVVLDGELVRP